MDGIRHYIGKWDLLIVHPPCTYLSNACACRLYPQKGQLNLERYAKGLEAKEFFMKFYNADCDRIAIENPLPSKIFELPPPSQVIQPYQYDDEGKHPYTLQNIHIRNIAPILIELVGRGLVGVEPYGVAGGLAHLLTLRISEQSDGHCVGVLAELLSDKLSAAEHI